MIRNEYVNSNVIRISVQFRDPDTKALFDPNTVSAKFADPAGTITTYDYGTDAELVKDSTGKYHVDVTVELVGTWFYTFIGDGSRQDASFEVTPSVFA